MLATEPYLYKPITVRWSGQTLHQAIALTRVSHCWPCQIIGPVFADFPIM